MPAYRLCNVMSSAELLPILRRAAAALRGEGILSPTYLPVIV